MDHSTPSSTFYRDIKGLRLENAETPLKRRKTGSTSSSSSTTSPVISPREADDLLPPPPSPAMPAAEVNDALQAMNGDTDEEETSDGTSPFMLRSKPPPFPFSSPAPVSAAPVSAAASAHSPTRSLSYASSSSSSATSSSSSSAPSPYRSTSSVGHANPFAGGTTNPPAPPLARSDSFQDGMELGSTGSAATMMPAMGSPPRQTWAAHPTPRKGRAPVMDLGEGDDFSEDEPSNSAAFSVGGASSSAATARKSKSSAHKTVFSSSEGASLSRQNSLNLPLLDKQFVVLSNLGDGK